MFTLLLVGLMKNEVTTWPPGSFNNLISKNLKQ